jgi:hypothetical protein
LPIDRGQRRALPRGLIAAGLGGYRVGLGCRRMLQVGDRLPMFSGQLQGSPDVGIFRAAVESNKLEAVRALLLKAVTNPFRTLSEYRRALGAFDPDLVVDHGAITSVKPYGFVNSPRKKTGPPAWGADGRVTLRWPHPGLMLRLLQRVIDRGELVVQRGAEAVDRGKNHNRNTRCDQSVFNGGGAGFIIAKLQKQALLVKPFQMGNPRFQNKNYSRKSKTA